jgi:hypothetical protein
MSAKVSVKADPLAELSTVLGGKNDASPSEVTSESVRAVTQRQLLEAARALGLSPPPKIKKDALAALVLDAWKGRFTGVKIEPDAPAHESPQTLPAQVELSHKFEVGGPRRAISARVGEGLTQISKEIPWGYGRDRVTAMPIDPDRLYAYWEVLDQSIAAAREQLGRGGATAWLNIRAYDVTGRIFDGTNAHSTIDHRIERGDRQWFFSIGKPSSELIVEVGMKSDEGFFVKIARSGRVEFPRRERAPLSDPEWLTVRMAGGQVDRGAHPVSGRGSRAASVAGPAAPAIDGTPTESPRHVPWEDALRFAEGGHERGAWEEVYVSETIESQRHFRWEGPTTITSWEAGPFPSPVEIPEPLREAFVGQTRVFKWGERTHIVYGPWQVVIRGLGAQQSRVTLSRWEMYRSWAAVAGVEPAYVGSDFARVGASDRMAGASERRWLGGSEIRVGGASELYFLKASELRLGGASERMMGGASQIVMRGASERRFLGASERRLGGGSDVRLERRFLGASEGRLADDGDGAPEPRLGTAIPEPPAQVDASPYPPPPGGQYLRRDNGSSGRGS